MADKQKNGKDVKTDSSGLTREEREELERATRRQEDRQKADDES